MNGFNCSYMDVKEAEDLLTRKIGAYVLTVNTMNRGQESITAEQAGLTYQSDGSVKKLMENQNRFRRLISIRSMRFLLPFSMMRRKRSLQLRH